MIQIKTCSRRVALELLREITEHHPVRFSIQGEGIEYQLSGTGIVDDAIRILITPHEDPIEDAMDSINSALEDVDCGTTRTALALVLTKEYIDHEKTKEEFIHNMGLTWDLSIKKERGSHE